MSVGRAQRPVALILVGQALLAAVAGCTFPGGRTTPAAGATLRLEIAIPSPSSTAPCTGQVRWTVVPVQPTGPSGQKALWFATEQLQVYPLQDPAQAGSFSCEFTNSPAVMFSTGTWVVEPSTGHYHGSCPVTLHDGLNVVTFRVRGGCAS